MIDITQTIISLDATADVSVVGNDVNQITWHDSNPNNITNAQILAKQVELQTAYDGVGLIQRNRAKEYPSIVDQLDDIYHNGIDAWKVTIKVTKDKYPK